MSIKISWYYKGIHMTETDTQAKALGIVAKLLYLNETKDIMISIDRDE